MSGVPGEERVAEDRRHRRPMRLIAASAVVVLSLGLATVAQRSGLLSPPEVLLQRPFGGSAAARQTNGPADGDLPGTSARHPGTVVDVPTHDLEHLPGVVLVGVLRGDPDVDGGCLWLEMDGAPQAVRWRPGSRAHLDPSAGGIVLELLDEAGQVLARHGETVYFTGARSGAAERLERCHVGGDHVWYVGAVTTDSPFE